VTASRFIILRVGQEGVCVAGIVMVLMPVSAGDPSKNNLLDLSVFAAFYDFEAE
jgi:hypothetical protein